MNTIFQPYFTLLGATSDDILINRLSLIALLYTIVVAISSWSTPAPYGRYSTSINHGFTIHPTLAWIIQESPSVFVPLILLFTTSCDKISQPANALSLFLFLFHYINRSFVFPFQLSSSAKPAPLSIVVGAMMFTSFNGFYQGHHLLNIREAKRFDLAFSFIGALCFILGMLINITHDKILSSLKKESTRKRKSSITESSASTSAQSDYKIPHGFLFKWISCPNYFGEALEWFGIAIITRSLPQLMFAFFTLIFLGLRAIHHHSFYQQKFQDRYPKQRKAIIPFLV